MGAVGSARPIDVEASRQGARGSGQTRRRRACDPLGRTAPFIQGSRTRSSVRPGSTLTQFSASGCAARRTDDRSLNRSACSLSRCLSCLREQDERRCVGGLEREEQVQGDEGIDVPGQAKMQLGRVEHHADDDRDRLPDDVLRRAEKPRRLLSEPPECVVTECAVQSRVTVFEFGGRLGYRSGVLHGRSRFLDPAMRSSARIAAKPSLDETRASPRTLQPKRRRTGDRRRRP